MSCSTRCWRPLRSLQSVHQLGARRRKGRTTKPARARPRTRLHRPGLLMVLWRHPSRTNPMNPLLREALAALERGWSVLPIHATGAALKQPHAGLLIAAGYREWVEDASRFRAVWKPLQLHAPSAEVVEHWFK